jgi:pimeloyl-ACP methyl ester carboxylesterase
MPNVENKRMTMSEREIVGRSAATTERTFVLVPGGWHGGWAWRPVAHRLRRAGHRAITVTPPGLSDGEDISNIALQDATDHLAFEIVRRNLSQIVLVGHSWAGYPTTAVAHRLGKLIVSQVVYYAAFVPAPGRALVDDCYPEHAAYFREVIDATPDNSIPISLDMVQQTLANGVDESIQRLLAEILVPQPGRYNTDCLDLPELTTIDVAAAYIRCEDDRAIPREVDFAARLGVEALTVPGSHESLLTHPDELTHALLHVAA